MATSCRTIQASWCAIAGRASSSNNESHGLFALPARQRDSTPATKTIAALCEQLTPAAVNILRREKQRCKAEKRCNEMRRVLIEHARAHQAAKRGGSMRKLYLNQTRELAADTRPDLIAIAEALQSLATAHSREGSVVEMKFFGGLEIKIAEVLNVSVKTVVRDWSFAKLWLCRELSQQSAHA